jgi:hypothetical protein
VVADTGNNVLKFGELVAGVVAAVVLAVPDVEPVAGVAEPAVAAAASACVIDCWGSDDWVDGCLVTGALAVARSAGCNRFIEEK